MKKQWKPIDKDWCGPSGSGYLILRTGLCYSKNITQEHIYPHFPHHDVDHQHFCGDYQN